MTRTEITADEYARLAGLLAAAKRHWEAMDLIEAQAREITGDEQFGHTFDAVFQAQHRTADDLLAALRIRVDGQKEPARA